MEDIEKKLVELREVVRGLESAVVAFSGGADSALVSLVAVQSLGRDNVLLATAESETYTPEERERAVRVAREIGARHVIVHTDEFADENFINNPPERCYYCKRELCSGMEKLRRENDFKYILDGTNADDCTDFRPGRRAADEAGVRSPLSEAGITKELVRAISKKLGLPTWNLPAQACLASRVPYGTRISGELLARIGRAEAAIKEICGVVRLRVRHHGNIARIEVAPDDMAKVAGSAAREKIVTALKALGYLYVTVDLAGYRTGSMNEVLREEQRKDRRE